MDFSAPIIYIFFIFQRVVSITCFNVVHKQTVHAKQERRKMVTPLHNKIFEEVICYPNQKITLYEFYIQRTSSLGGKKGGGLLVPPSKYLYTVKN